MEDSESNVDARSTGAASNRRGGGALFKNPAIVGGASAAVALLLGVIIGRASVANTHRDDTLVRAEGHLAQRPDKGEEPEDEAPEPTTEFRRHLGRKLPAGSKGFARSRVAKRPVALLAGERATLSFDIAPNDAAYVLTSVVVLDGAKTAKVQVELDGKPLGDSSLNEGWGIYASPIPAGALSSGSHELAFHQESSAGTSVGLESIAIIPVTAEVELKMGTGAAGSMIDGFAGPARDSVWSTGLRSTLGVVLAKAEGNYRLKVRGAAISKLAPMTVSATVNGKALGTGLFEKKLTSAEWAVPANTLQAGINRIEFSYPQTATPSEYNPNSRDNRPLALRFHQVTLRPDQ